MARFRRPRKPYNPDTGVWPFRNRMEGALCARCGKLITGTESHPGEVKAWQRIAGQSCNWHLACALEVGKLVNRAAYEKILANNPDLDRIELPPAPHPAPMPHPAVMDENFHPVIDPVDVDVPEVDPEVENAEPEPAEPVVVAPPAAPALPPWMEGFAQAILPYIEGRINGKLDKDAVLDLINRHAVKRNVIEIHDKANGQRRDVQGYHHPNFRFLLDQCDMHMHSALIGPPASGKSTEARLALREMGLKLYVQGPVSAKHELVGYCDGAGVYHPTPFFAWFTSKEPAGIIFEEMDGSEANALLDANPALENRICNFPYQSEPVEMGNPASVAIALLNTWGHGGTDDFCGRLPQDAAAMDRFAPLAWDYDEDAEFRWAGNDEWVRRVQKFRANARRKGIRVHITPRASIRGAKKLAKGWAQAMVEKTEVRRSMSDTDWAAIQ